jgi:2-amino-4-hydroxy-6-hydroxymethyldihydropteridine diphosphokinase
MATCLVALGSNSGNREASLDGALAELAAAGRVRRHSRLYRSRPVGGPPGQADFLNAAAVVETAIDPLPLLALLQKIEAGHARQRGVRWAARTLDLDLLLYDAEVIESAELTVPHPRMSFRRFVLEPAAEIAGQMVHPTIGWTIDRLLHHLDAAADQVAIVSPIADRRRQLATMLAGRFAAQTVAPPADGVALPLWPPELTTWMALNPAADGGPPASAKRQSSVPAAEYPTAGRPKLTIILDSEDADVPSCPSGTSTGQAAGVLLAGRPSETSPDWSSLRLAHDRGPTLILRTSDAQAIGQEAFAAVEAVWPQLCLPGQNA